MKKLILGSSSPRRIELLGKLGLDFETMSPDIDERLDGVTDPSVFVKRIAAKKAQKLIEDSSELFLRDKVLLTADTVVVFEDDIIGKPKSKEHARNILKRLSGKTHFVYSGLCYLYEDEITGEKICEESLAKTDVLFKELDTEEIENYIETSEPYDKAGAYAIQGQASFMVKEIKGSFTNVVGLPLAEVSDRLKELLH